MDDEIKAKHKLFFYRVMLECDWTEGVVIAPGHGTARQLIHAKHGDWDDLMFYGAAEIEEGIIAEYAWIHDDPTCATDGLELPPLQTESARLPTNTKPSAH